MNDCTANTTNTTTTRLRERMADEAIDWGFDEELPSPAESEDEDDDGEVPGYQFEPVVDQDEAGEIDEAAGGGEDGIAAEDEFIQPGYEHLRGRSGHTEWYVRASHINDKILGI